MPMLAFVSTEEDRNAYPRGHVTAAAERIITVPDAAMVLFRRIGLKPPESGTYSMTDLDAKLAPLSSTERMQAKTYLQNVAS